MLKALLIIVDEDFGTPLYADPSTTEMEPEHWTTIRERIVEVLEGDAKNEGSQDLGEVRMTWKVLTRNGLSFIALTEGLAASEVTEYLKELVRHYFDEVDDARHPDRDGVVDVVVDVIPPWDD